VIAVTSRKGGVILPVLAQPGAKRNAILGERSGALRVAVTAAPDRGKANEAIQTVLAERLGLKPSQVSLISGATSRQKRFLVEGIESQELQARLTALFP
jgi:uncharacterized protein (TIGR00251 family)